MIEQITKKIQSFFPYHKKKAIEDWDFIMVFQQYYAAEVQMMFESLQCKDAVDWKLLRNPSEKQALFLMRMEYNIVTEMAHQLKILKKKDKGSYKLTLKDVNKLIYMSDKQKSQSIYNYLCFIRGRLSKKNRQIYEQQKYSPFNKNKQQKYIRDQNGRLFTQEQELRAKYHYMVTYTQKIEQKQGSLGIQDNAKQPFNIIMKHPGFIQLVPIQRVSQHRSFILGSIKDSVGPNIDCYFDFISFLQKWLIFPMIVGLFTMACNNYFSRTADNSPFDFIYALAIMLWSILFITRWQQIQKWTKVKQSCGSSQVWTQVQNQINKRHLQKRMSQVTGQVQYNLSFKTRVLLGIASNSLCILMLLGTLTFIMYSLNARGFIDPHHKLFYSQLVSSWAGRGGIFDSNTIRGQIPIIVHVIVTNGFDQNVYRKIVKVLAKYERHQSRKGYENSIILKYFIFQFFITFADLFYIAFVRFDIEGLRQQLLSLFFIDIIRRVVAQTVVPWIRKLYRSHSLKQSSTKQHLKQQKSAIYYKNQMSLDEQLQFGAILQINKDDYQPFDDYLQIISNIGYLVMISSCFPLAPLLIFIAHQVQLIQDRYKIIHIFKRKLPQCYVGMGRWKNIIVFICYISIITNIMLFAFSSQQVVSFFPKMYESGKDLVYGNTDVSSLIQSATSSILQSVLSPLNATIGLAILNNTVIDGSQVFFSDSDKDIASEKVDQLISLNNNEVINEDINDEYVECSTQFNQTSSGKQCKAPSINLKMFKPPRKQQQTTFIAILFFIQHFFLLLFILIRDVLKRRKSQAEIFLQRRQYKRRIKKNLPRNIITLLTQNLLKSQKAASKVKIGSLNSLQYIDPSFILGQQKQKSTSFPRTQSTVQTQDSRLTSNLSTDLPAAMQILKQD